jgi:hypothetical protein
MNGPILAAAAAIRTVSVAQRSITYDGGYLQSIGFSDPQSFNDHFAASGSSLDVGDDLDWGDGVSMRYDLTGDQDLIEATIEFHTLTQGAFRFYFTLDCAAKKSLSFGGDFNDMLLYVSQPSEGAVVDVDGAHEATLGGGQYYVVFLQGQDGNDTFGTMRLDFTHIPTPGAIALLGLAGFTSRRRRPAG